MSEFFSSNPFMPFVDNHVIRDDQMDIISCASNTTIIPEKYDPFNPMEWSVSYVRPNKTPGSAKVTDDDVSHWREKQKILGRYVISDSHFQMGGNLRSVPKLGDPELSQLKKSRLFLNDLNRKRTELGLPEVKSPFSN